MATLGRGSSHAHIVGSAGKPLSKKKRKKLKKDRKLARKIAKELDPAVVLALSTQPLLELFAVVDDVMTETDAFDPAKMKAGFGRIYRGWKSSRQQIDEGFNASQWGRVKSKKT